MARLEVLLVSALFFRHYEIEMLDPLTLPASESSEDIECYERRGELLSLNFESDLLY